MSIKPEKIAEWALLNAAEVRAGGNNKVEPKLELKNNGTLDGNLQVGTLNWLFNTSGLWQAFLSDMIEVADGNGLKLTKDNHSCLIFAQDKTLPSRFIFGNAFKNGANAALVNTISSSTLTFGTPLTNGTVPILGATATNIQAISINFIK